MSKNGKLEDNTMSIVPSPVEDVRSPLEMNTDLQSMPSSSAEATECNANTSIETLEEGRITQSLSKPKSTPVGGIKLAIQLKGTVYIEAKLKEDAEVYDMAKVCQSRYLCH
jgi:hypothetical protein